MTIIPLPAGSNNDDLPDWMTTTVEDFLAREEHALARQKRRVRQMRRERRRETRREAARRASVYGRPVLLWTGTVAFAIAVTLLAFGERDAALELLKVAAAAWTAFVAIPSHH